MARPNAHGFALGIEGGRMYHLITQSAREVLQPENAPARSMSEYLVQTDQAGLLTSLSVYTLRGNSAQQVRLLYMNDAALALWQKMGHAVDVQETMKRPARKAELCFGLPYSE